MENDWKTLNAMEEFELQMIILVARMTSHGTFHCQYSWAQSEMLCLKLSSEMDYLFLDTTSNTKKIFDRPLSRCLLDHPNYWDLE
jgi:hypothetical protein